MNDQLIEYLIFFYTLNLFHTIPNLILHDIFHYYLQPNHLIFMIHNSILILVVHLYCSLSLSPSHIIIVAFSILLLFGLTICEKAFVQPLLFFMEDSLTLVLWTIRIFMPNLWRNHILQSWSPLLTIAVKLGLFLVYSWVQNISWILNIFLRIF